MIVTQSYGQYLGIIIDDKMSWKDQIDYISLKIKQNFGMMKRVRRDVPTECLISLYRTLVEPYIRYCNTTWGGYNISLLDTLQTLQNRAARVIANVKYENTNHAKLLKDLDWLNVRELIELDTASLMCKIENDLASTQMKEMFVKTSDLPTSAQGQLPLVAFISLTGSLILEKLLFPIGCTCMESTAC